MSTREFIKYNIKSIMWKNNTKMIFALLTATKQMMEDVFQLDWYLLNKYIGQKVKYKRIENKPWLKKTCYDFLCNPFPMIQTM